MATTKLSTHELGLEITKIFQNSPNARLTPSKIFKALATNKICCDVNDLSEAMSDLVFHEGALDMFMAPGSSHDQVEVRFFLTEQYANHDHTCLPGCNDIPKVVDSDYNYRYR